MNAKATDTKEVYFKALSKLQASLATPVLTDRDLAGVIQHFEFTYETCWKALKARLATLGIEAFSPRESFEKAFQSKFIADPAVWGEMIQDRNLTVHTYNEKLAHEILARIETRYLPAFSDLALRLG